MLYNKANKIIFDAITKHDRVCYWEHAEGEYAVTADGLVAFVFPEKEISFNLKKATRLPKSPIEYMSVIKPENKLVETEFYMFPKCVYSRKQIMRCFEKRGYLLYARETFVDYFPDSVFYQDAENDLSPIVATEGTGEFKKVV